MWVPLAAVLAATVVIFIVYLQPRHIPIKYLIPGTVFLIAFQVIPVIATVATAFTNFGDGHRGTKQDAITAIQTASVERVPGSIDYTMTIATEGTSTRGPTVLLLYDPTTKTLQKGTTEGLTPLTDATVTPAGK